MPDKIRVLYVDDEPALLDLCKTFLERSGDFTVTTVESSSEAIRILERERFDAIVSDYQMPEMNGIEFLKHLKAGGNSTPFIIFTGKGREEIVIEALNEGADGYLQKGGELKSQFAELVHKIRRAVSLRQTGDDLRVSEGRYRCFIETANEGIWEMNSQFTTTFVNKKMAEMLGYAPEEMIGVDVSSFMHPDDRADHASRMEERKKGFADQYERRFIRKDGTVIWTIASATALEGPDGTFRGSFGMFTDITGRKIAEEALLKERDFANSVVGTAQAIILILDIKGHIVFMNPYMEAISGYSLDEVKGKDWFEIFLPSQNQESTRSVFRNAVGNIQTRGKVDVILTKDGRERLIEWFDKTLRGADGGIEGLLAIGQDITARIQAEESLRKSEERYRAIVEDQTEFICRFSPHGRLTFANDAYCRYFSLDKNQCLDRPHSVVLPPEDLRMMKQHLASLTQENPVATIEHRIVMPSGEVRWQRWNDRAIFHKNGQVVEYQSVGRDITEIKTAEKILRESEEYYRTIFENTGTASVIIEEDTTISLANTEFAGLCGYTREEIEGKKSWTEFVVKEDLERMLTQHYSRRKNHEAAEKHYEFRFVRKNGEVRNIFLSIDVIPGTKKSVASLLDITGRIHSEQTLQKREAQLRAILQGSPIPNFVIDRDHRVIMWNKALEEASGIKAEEVLGTNEHWRAFYDHERSCLVDLLLDGAIEKLPGTYIGIKKSAVAEGGFEATDFFPHLGESGKWLRIVAAPVLDGNGTVIGGVETLEDITPVKEAEQSLRKSEQRYYNIIEDQTEFVCRFLPDGTHVFVNEAYARYFGKRRDEMIGEIFRPNIHPDDRGMVRQFFASLTPEHPVDLVEQRILMPDGEVRWQHWSDRAIFDDTGTLVEYQSVGRDTTTQKQAEEALRQANRQLEILTSITRHDILNEVSIILGYLSLANDLSKDPVLNTYLEKLEAATQAIQLQIEFTRVFQDVGIHEPQWQKLASLMPKEHLPPGIVMTVAVQNISVFANPMIAKVFFNLLDNSARHGRHVTEVTVRCRESDNGLVITWQDNGAGIPPVEKERIFERGYGKNTGLGLFLIREILSITGITIVETGTPGEGARFEIIVPRGAYRVQRSDEHQECGFIPPPAGE